MLKTSYDEKAGICTIEIPAKVQDVGNEKTLRFFTTGGNVMSGIYVDCPMLGKGVKREVVLGLNGYVRRS